MGKPFYVVFGLRKVLNDNPEIGKYPDILDTFFTCFFFHFRLQSLESSLEQKEKELSDQKVKFNKLKEDFKYNLKLLNERHAELDNYDKLVLGKFLVRVNVNGKMSRNRESVALGQDYFDCWSLKLLSIP